MVILPGYFFFLIYPQTKNQLKNTKYWVTKANIVRNIPNTHKNNVFYAYYNYHRFYDCHGIIYERQQLKNDNLQCLSKVIY